MTREQLVETMARALCEAQRHLPDDPTWENTCARDLYELEANATLTALEAAGMVVVPREVPVPPMTSTRLGCPVCEIGADGKPYAYVCMRNDCPTRAT